QRPADDHAHRVIEIGAPHLLFETDRKRFLGELIHLLRGPGEEKYEPKEGSRAAGGLNPSLGRAKPLNFNMRRRPAWQAGFGGCAGSSPGLPPARAVLKSRGTQPRNRSHA